jgi:Pentapeptide repeats (8 copies)
MILESTPCSPDDPPGVESPVEGIDIVPFMMWSFEPAGAELLPGATGNMFWIGKFAREPIPPNNAPAIVPAVDPFTGVVLTGVVLTGVVLTGVVLTGVVLTGVVLTGVVLTGVVLTGVVLTGVVLTVEPPPPPDDGPIPSLRFPRAICWA